MKIVEGPAGARDLAIIDGTLPRKRDWEAIFSRSLTVNVLSMPGKASTLDALLPWAGSIRYLAINSFTCSDLRLLNRFERLEWLAIGGRVTAAPRDFSLPHVEFFGGPLRGFEPLVALPSLREVKLTMGGAPTVEALSPALISVSLLSARAVARLDFLSPLTQLSSLTVHGARSLDLTALGSMPTLRTVHFETCKELSGVDALADLPELDGVWFEDCPSIDVPDALRDLAAQVRVIGRGPFDSEFQRSAGPNWTFPPGQGC